MTIIFAAHEPFGKMTYSYLDGQDTDGAKNYCDILKAEQMPDAPSLTGGQCLIYNCGSENAPAVITLQGEAPKGIVIENKTNGTKCAITGLPYELPLRIDGWDGSVAVGEDRKLEFLYHEEGFISLAPCGLIGEAITAEAGERENIIRVSGAEADELIGAYIYINGEWVKMIGRQGDGSIALAHGVTIESPITTMAATMNE